MSSRIGKVDFIAGGNTYQTWYKVLGALNTGQKTPVVVLHGGPGMTHHYMLPHQLLFSKFDIPVIFYDQIGNGESTHIKDKPSEFWTPQLFMDELDNLLKHLGIYEHFDLIGHSWGGHYAAERSPPGLRKLIIANAPASVPLFVSGTNHLLNQFPSEFVQTMHKLEDEGKCSSAEYQAGVMQFYGKHVCTTDPWPQELLDSFNAVGANPTVYHTMFGESEFNITGTLKDWSIVEMLHNVKYMTLLISAPLDEVQECAFLPFFRGISKVKWVEIPTSTHLAMFEDPERYFDIVLKFLTL